MGLGWLFFWFDEFYNMLYLCVSNLRSLGLEQDFLNRLKKVLVIFFFDGIYGLLDEGIIWFYVDCINVGVGEVGYEVFFYLYVILRIVSYVFFFEVLSDVVLVKNCIRML